MNHRLEDVGAAIDYTQEPFRLTGSKLMGRHSAGASFLRAMVRHGPRTLYAFTRTRDEFDDFVKDVRSESPAERPLVWIPKTQPERLAEPGVLFAPGPGIADLAWPRRHAGDTAFSLCGVTYTVSSDRVMDGLGACFTAPVHPWDALVCISEPTRQAILALLEDWRDYHHERFGQRPGIPMRLPVIPLGVHAEDFAAETVPAQQVAEFRQRFALEPDELVVLFVGRLSHHSKGNPLPMFMAVERAAVAAKRRVRLMLFGRFPNTATRDAFVSGLTQFAPGIRASFLDGRDSMLGRCAWRAADVFCSFSDNVQESFGLTTVEALAAGLPLVVSDWDGYKDTVVDGENGFRIPTTMVEPGRGEALMQEYAVGAMSYDRFIGLASLAVGVDIAAAASAFQRLFEDAALRRRMGEASRERARRVFEWSVVLAQYQALWVELETERRRAAARAPGSRHPGRPDPFRMFAAYPTRLLTQETRLAPGPSHPRHAPDALLTHALVSFVGGYVAPAAVLPGLVERVTRVPGTTVGDLRREFSRVPTDQLDWSVAFLIKMGFLVALPAGSGPDQTTLS